MDLPQAAGSCLYLSQLRHTAVNGKAQTSASLTHPASLMFVDDSRIQRGKRAKRKLRARVGQITRADRSVKCYIGTTSDYSARARSHRRRNSHYKRMVVLFETTDIDEVREIEADLIGHTDLRNVNILPGGEGLKRGKSRYYVYVLIEPVVEETGFPWVPMLGGGLVIAGLIGLAKQK